MLWIKRNLFFVIGLAIAVVLLGLGIWNLVNKLTDDADVTSKLDDQFNQLKTMYDQDPFPSKENLKAIDDDRQRVTEFITSSRKYFTPIPPVNAHDPLSFKAELDNAIFRFNNEAHGAHVTVTTNYSYSFEALRSLYNFDRASIRPLALQVAEVEKILDVLFAARINGLTSIQRARVAVEDQPGTATIAADYVDPYIPRTNAVSVVMPYQVKFRCFSSELAKVVEGFVKSPHGFIIVSINVEPVASDDTANGGAQAAPVAPVAPDAHTLTPLFKENPFTVTMLLNVVSLKNR